MENKHSFNLVTEPWIPVTTKAGGIVELGLRELFARLDSLVDIAAPPHIWIGIMRLLACILQCVMPPKDDAEWARAVTNDLSPSDLKRIDAYLMKWKHRFDLFDAKRPFGQVPGLGGDEDDGDEDRLAAKLLLTRAVAKAARLMDWSVDSAPEPMSPAEAARALLGAQACAVQGGNSKPWYFSDAPVSAVANFVLIGDTLRQTLSALLLPPDLAASVRTPSADADDAPLWAWDSLIEPTDGKNSSYARGVRGPLDHLSWTSRAVKLEPESSESGTVVRHAKIRQGHWIVAKDMDAQRSPWGFYRTTGKDKKVMRLGVNSKRGLGRPTWLVAATVLAGGEGCRRPLSVDLALRSGVVAPITERARLRMVGVNHDKSNIRLIVSDEIDTGTSLANAVTRAPGTVWRVLEITSGVMAVMNDTVHNVVLNGRKVDMNTKKTMRDRVTESDAYLAMWNDLRRLTVERLTTGDVNAFNEAASRVAWQARTRFAASLGKSARSMIGAAKAGV